MKTDGRIIINEGSIIQCIQKELNLTNEDCSKLGNIWENLIENFPNENSENDTNTKSKNKYYKQVGNMIEFSKDFWQKLVEKINKKLHKNIQIVDSDEQAKFNIKTWYLDDKHYWEYDTKNGLTEWIEIFPEDKVKKGREWYKEYKEQYGEMNFKTALKYLKGNPNLDNDIQNYIKTAFGICDGDISKNRQGAKGTCHLLACVDELGDHPELKEIVNNIVKQNDNATVTVTFFGILDKNKKPINFVLTNKEIVDSYKYEGIGARRGSTDPDAAALEIAYQKLIEKINQEFTIINEKIELLREKSCILSLNITLKSISEDDTNPDIHRLKIYLQNNIDKFNNMKWSDILNKMSNDNIKDIFWDNMNTEGEEFSELYKQIDALDSQKKFLYNKYGLSTNFLNYNSKDLSKTLGEKPDITFQRLTGKKAKGLNINCPENWYEQENANEIWRLYTSEAVDKFLQTNNYKTTPTVIGFQNNNEDLKILKEHAYSLKDIYNNSNGEKYVKIKNPHGYDIEIKYSDFLNNVSELYYLEL